MPVKGIRRFYRLNESLKRLGLREVPCLPVDAPKRCNGNSNIRNPILVSYVAKGLLPYHGLGSGIKRALEQWPQIEFTDDHDGCLFRVTVTREPVEELDLVVAYAPGDGPGKPIAPKNAPKNGENASINAPRNVLQRQILDLIRSNSEISYDDLARLTGKDRTTVMRNISKLKTLGFLKRIGSKKAGHWEIIESHKP